MHCESALLSVVQIQISTPTSYSRDLPFVRLVLRKRVRRLLGGKFTECDGEAIIDKKRLQFSMEPLTERWPRITGPKKKKPCKSVLQLGMAILGRGPYPSPSVGSRPQWAFWDASHTLVGLPFVFGRMNIVSSHIIRVLKGTLRSCLDLSPTSPSQST